MMFIAGIDEAGRGPVIGPMVMAGAMFDEKDIPRLKAMGVKDSKLLTREKRDELFVEIKKIAKSYEIIITGPKEIDSALESDHLNLNWLEAHKTAEIINKLKPGKVTVDSPSNNCSAYASYLKKLLKHKTELECINKADLLHVYVGAASILAKVTRDREMDNIQKKYGNCGPGYMSNETTQKFLAENWEKHPEIFRHSWTSYKNHQNMKHQKKLEDFHKFVEEESNFDVPELKKYGYKKIKTTSDYELARFKGRATVVLYHTKKAQVQGNEPKKQEIKKILEDKGFQLK